MARAAAKTRRPPKAAARRSLRPEAIGAGLLFGLCGLVVLAPLITAAVGRPASSVYEATGYDRLVDGLLAKLGWLRVDYSDPDRPRVVLSKLAPRREGGADDTPLRQFRRYSYLGQDMQRADENVWRFDPTGERVVGVQPEAHRLARPFADATDWTGDLKFRGGDAEALVLTSRSGPSLSFVSPASPGVVRALRVPIGLQGDEGLRAQRFDLTAGDRTVASLFLAGGVVMARVYPASGLSVSLGGRPVAPSGGAPVLQALGVGETVSVSGPGVSGAYALQTGASDISRYEPGRPRARFPGLESLARGVETAMGRTSADVRTTLDRDLQAAAQTALARKAEALRDDGPAFPASAVLMDAGTGEILALATYPSSRDQLDDRAARSVRTDPMLERNQGFVRLPIGSIAKVPFSLAILQADPSLAGLYVPPASDVSEKDGKAVRQFRTLLGVDLGASIDDHVLPAGGARPGMIDFQTFLSHSSNKYAAALMLLALAPPGHPEGQGASEPYAIGGRELHRAPDLPMLAGARDRGFGLIPRPEGELNLPWMVNLQSDFGLDAQASDLPPGRAYDFGVWGPFAGTGFDGVSPEREAFGLGSVHSLASDYVMTILGGGRSRWTTVKVAEVYSRIVTRRAVRAHLTQQGASPPAPLKIEDAAWRPVMQGLLGVAAPGGTGATLADSKPTADGGVVRIFAKTGTPTVEQYVGRKPANRALQSFIDQGCRLSWDAAKGRIVVPADLSGSRCLGGYSPGEVRREIARLNHSVSGGVPPRGLQVAGGAVIAVPVDPEVRSLFAHAVAVVVARYKDEAAPWDKPQRALTLVVNLQKRPEGDKLPALEVARTLLKDPSVRAWLASDPGAGGTRR